MGVLIHSYFLMDWKEYIKITVLMKSAKLPVEVMCHLREQLASSHTQNNHF